MFARKGMFSSIGRAGAVATVVAVALPAFEPSAAFAGIVGTGIAIAATQNRRHYYDDGYYYGRPAYYGGDYYGPRYYGGGPYYRGW